MSLPEEAALAIAPLEPGYDAPLAAVTDVAVADDRVRALWLGGSVARGVADAGSDLDVIVTVTNREPFTSPSVWSALDPVITTAIPGLPGCFAFTTRRGLRVDVVIETPEEVASSAYVHRVAVVDKDGLAVPTPGGSDRAPDLDRMQTIVTEYLRQSAIFPAAVVAREDWLLGQVAVHNYQRMLYDLFVEANQPVPPMGVKQWSSRLTPEQRAVLAALPAPAADRDSVVAAMRAVRRAIGTEGRAALERSGGHWPTEVEDAMASYWERHGLPSA